MKCLTPMAFALPLMLTLAACGSDGSGGSGSEGCPDGQDLNPITGECAATEGGEGAGGGGDEDAGGIDPQDVGGGGGDEDTGGVDPMDARGGDEDTGGVDPEDAGGGGEEDAGQVAGDPYVSTANPWAVGPLATTASQVAAEAEWPPVDASVCSPAAPAT